MEGRMKVDKMPDDEPTSRKAIRLWLSFNHLRSEELGIDTNLLHGNVPSLHS